MRIANQQYYTLPGTDITVPIMSLGEDLMKLSLGGSRIPDPIANAAKRGKIPTLGEVKRSLKVRTCWLFIYPFYPARLITLHLI